MKKEKGGIRTRKPMALIIYLLISLLDFIAVLDITASELKYVPSNI